MIFISIFGLVLLYLLKQTYVRWTRALHLGRSFPYPPTVPLFGNLLDFSGKPSEIFDLLNEYFKKYGKNYVLFGIFYEPTLFISNPKDVETLLSDYNTKSSKKSIEYGYLEPWLGQGLLTSSGEKWFTRRKIITPCFHFKILDTFADAFNEQSNILVKKLEDRVGKGSFNIYNDVTLFTIDVMCEAAMGIKVNAQFNPDCEYSAAVKEMTELLHKRFFHIWKHYPLLFDFVSNGRKSVDITKELHKFTTDVICKRREIISNVKYCVNDNKNNLLDMLLISTVNGMPLTNEDIREEVDTFMFEGHDTTSSAISFTLFQLAQNQEIQNKVFYEVQDILGTDKDNYVSFKKLNDLKYLDMVIKETLRMWPSVPFIGRQLSADTLIGPNRVPAGTDIIIAIYALHYDPDIYSNPNIFDPHRFSENDRRERKPFTYIPFSAGARNCIGQKFALLEIKTVVSKIVSKFQLISAPKQNCIELQADFILKSANGLNVQLKPRI